MEITKENKFLHSTLQYVEDHFTLKSQESKDILRTLFLAVYESGIAVGYHMKQMPRDTAFMAAFKKAVTIHKECGAPVFPMWIHKKNMEKRCQNLLWWCQECGNVLDNTALGTLDIDGRIDITDDSEQISGGVPRVGDRGTDSPNQ